MSESAYLVFSVGPVQACIAAARKVEDLWAGSYALSYLAAVAVRCFEAARGEVLVPNTQGNPLVEMLAGGKSVVYGALPNKLEVLFSAGEGAARDAAVQAEGTVRKAWQAMAQRVYDRRVPESLRTPALKGLWESQVGGYLEVYWATGVERAGALRRFEARKRLRDFTGWHGLGVADTLGGDLPALCEPGSSCVSQVRRFWQRIAQSVSEEATLRPDGSERLSAVSLTKRFLRRDALEPHNLPPLRVPDTSSLACQSFLHWATQLVGEAPISGPRKEAADALVEFYEWVAEYGLTAKRSGGVAEWLTSGIGDYLLEDTFREQWLKRERLHPGCAWPSESDFDDVRQARREALARCKAAGAPPLRRYYAVLLMDGDLMGRLFGSLDWTRRRGLSLRVAEYAHRVVPDIVAAHNGFLVYAGGDDLLAILPLEQAVPAADRLRAEFSRLMSSALGLNGPSPTVSAGIVVAHHLTPLDHVLAQARETEHLAKTLYGRDAICVRVLTRSGPPRTLGSKWSLHGVRLAEVLEGLRQATAGQFLSDRFGYLLERESVSVQRVDAAGQLLLLQRGLRDHYRGGPPSLRQQIFDGLASLFVPAAATAEPPLRTAARLAILARVLAKGDTA